MLYVLWLRRKLPETKRFQTAEHKREVWRPLITLFKDYPARMALLIAMSIPAAFAAANISSFQSKYLQHTHGWRPWQVALMVIVGGLIAILGATSAGALSDRLGRRTVLTGAIILFVICFGSFYGLASGPILIPLWIAGIFAFLMCDVLIGGMTAELFPTSHRSLASAVRYFFWIMTGAVALFLEGPLYDRVGSHGAAIAILILPGPLALIPIWFLPEPARQPLDMISAERTP